MKYRDYLFTYLHDVMDTHFYKVFWPALISRKKSEVVEVREQKRKWIIAIFYLLTWCYGCKLFDQLWFPRKIGTLELRERKRKWNTAIFYLLTWCSLTSFDFPEKSELQKLESGNGSEISRFTYMMLWMPSRKSGSRSSSLEAVAAPLASLYAALVLDLEVKLNNH